jgi:hypothetical protein
MTPIEGRFLEDVGLGACSKSEATKPRTSTDLSAPLHSSKFPVCHLLTELAHQRQKKRPHVSALREQKEMQKDHVHPRP